MGGVVLQGLQDCWGDWWGGGDSGADGLEAVLVGDVADLHDLAVGGGEAVAALGGGAGAFGGGLLDSVLLGSDAITGLVAKTR